MALIVGRRAIGLPVVRREVVELLPERPFMAVLRPQAVIPSVTSGRGRVWLPIAQKEEGIVVTERPFMAVLRPKAVSWPRPGPGRVWLSPLVTEEPSALPVVEQSGFVSDTAVASLDQSIDLGSYADGALFCLVMLNNNGLETVTAVTWNGSESLTLAGAYETDNDARVEVWYLVNPTSGNFTLECDFSATLLSDVIVGYVVVSGVDQTEPVGNVAGKGEQAGGPAGASYSQAVGCDDDDLVLGVICGESVGALTPDSGQTDHINTAVGSLTYGAVAAKPGVAVSTAVGWTFVSDDHRAMMALEVNRSGTVQPERPFTAVLRPKAVDLPRPAIGRVWLPITQKEEEVVVTERPFTVVLRPKAAFAHREHGGRVWLQPARKEIAVVTERPPTAVMRPKAVRFETRYFWRGVVWLAVGRRDVAASGLVVDMFKGGFFRSYVRGDE